MKIQSLSVVVPTSKCVNSCKFCVSRMKEDPYKNQMDDNLPFYDLYEKEYIRRLEFSRDNGCNTVILTGNGEPQQNRAFLSKFGFMNANLSKPFRWIEMQTTGVMIDEKYLRFLRNHVGVSTISLSLSALNNQANAAINGSPNKIAIDINHICGEIKRYDFNLRLSLNMTKWFEPYDYSQIITTCRALGANQVTFRKLYSSGNDTEQDKWIEQNAASNKWVDGLTTYIQNMGTELEILPYGARKYSLNTMGVVLDDDCMSKELKETFKYLILRPDCKLYSQWDDPASLIF